MAHDRGLPTNPQVLVEFGPGSSIGTGLAALIAGGAEYFALDIVKSAATAGNLAVFDRLVELFRARADIPGEKEFPEVEPRLPTYRFPAHVLTAARLARALDAPRLARLRRSVAAAGSSGSDVRYLAPWHNAVLDGRLADMVLSQAVLEHVDDLAHAYQKMYDWLKPGGVMSHVIDFRCHHTARSWNGHWTYSDLTWTLIRGRRPYFINRAPCSTHASLLRQTGFEVVFECPRPQSSTIGEKHLASSFRKGTLTQADLLTSGLFVQAVKPLTTA
jgi:SAM-dependent methyltransferase